MQTTKEFINLTTSAKQLIYQNSNPAFSGQGIQGISNVIFNKEIQLKDLKQEDKDKVANNSFVQFSYQLKELNPSVVFVKDSSTLDLVDNFSDLPRLELDEVQKAKVEAFLDKNKDNPKFYNGEHFAVRNMLYDPTGNTVYIEAKATNYATMSAVPEVLRNNFFRLGVISPIITSDSKTYLLERNDLLKLWSTVGGFVQPINDSLNNLVLQTASNEFIEELIGDKDGNARDTNLVSKILLNAISFRALHSSLEKPSAQIPTAELIAPIMLNITSDKFETDYLNKNCAKDRQDHTVVSSTNIDGVNYVQNKYQKVDLLNLNSILNSFYDGKAGDFLYKPVIISALEAIGVMISAQDPLEQVKEIRPEDLAARLLYCESLKYKLTPETPYLTEIVKRILETNSILKIKVLTDDIIQAALDKNDDNYDTIKKLWDTHKLYDNGWMQYINQSNNKDLKIG